MVSLCELQDKGKMARKHFISYQVPHRKREDSKLGILL